MSPVPWQLSVVVTVAVTVAVPYAMLRVSGLCHSDVAYVGNRAYREGVAEVIALSGTPKTADVFTGNHKNTESGDEGGEESGEESGEKSDILPPEQIATDANSTETESTDLHQQTEPEP